jgi:hypothetical protein
VKENESVPTDISIPTAVHELDLENPVSDIKHIDRLNFLMCSFYGAKNRNNYNPTFLQHTPYSRMYEIFKFTYNINLESAQSITYRQLQYFK